MKVLQSTNCKNYQMGERERESDTSVRESCTNILCYEDERQRDSESIGKGTSTSTGKNIPITMTKLTSYRVYYLLQERSEERERERSTLYSFYLNIII